MHRQLIMQWHTTVPSIACTSSGAFRFEVTVWVYL